MGRGWGVSYRSPVTAPSIRLSRARLSLDGLSIGDAFGERFFVNPDVVEQLIEARAMPASPWRWTDDTAMGISIVETLAAHERIDPDDLARRFMRRWAAQPDRGYGGGAHALLQKLAMGGDWREESPALFRGTGSYGNGAAMRAAPVGAYFAGDLDRVVAEAEQSAIPTHWHAEGRAGAIAVAVAAALAATGTTGELLLAECEARTPSGPTRRGIAEARTIHFDCKGPTAASWLGSGANVAAEDTVPFALWCAAKHLGDFEAAMWTTVSGLGDRDTTSAIVGGIVALSAPDTIPAVWRDAREPLPSGG